MSSTRCECGGATDAGVAFNEDTKETFSSVICRECGHIQRQPTKGSEMKHMGSQQKELLIALLNHRSWSGKGDWFCDSKHKTRQILESLERRGFVRLQYVLTETGKYYAEKIIGR